MQPSRSLTLAVAVWSWPDTLREIDRRVLSFGVRRRQQQARWRGLRVELQLEVEGTPSQLDGFSRFIASLAFA